MDMAALTLKIKYSSSTARMHQRASYGSYDGAATYIRRPYTSAVAGAIPLQSGETRSCWKGYAAFQVIDDSKGLRLRVSPTYSPLTVIDDEFRQHRSTPTILYPEWWGGMVRDEQDTKLPVSTWCASLREAVIEAASSQHRGVNNGSLMGSRGTHWWVDDHWWLVWELTLWSDTITGLVNANSISPTAISVAGRKPLDDSPLIKAWNISRPFDMTTISGQHLQHRSLGKIWEVPRRADGEGYIG